MNKTTNKWQNLKDTTFTNSETARLLNSVSRMDTQRANAMVSAYDEESGMTARQYQIAFNEMVQEARNNGLTVQQMIEAKDNNEATRDLTIEQVYKIHNYVNTLNEQMKEVNLSKDQVRVIDAIKKATGINVVIGGKEFAEGGEQAGSNGYFNPADNSIHISDTTVNPATVVFSHEYTAIETINVAVVAEKI